MATHIVLPDPCHSKLERSSNYRSVCVNPCAMPDGRTPYKNQIHHILCEHAILDRQPTGDADGSKAKFIQECLCLIDWDINEEPNLIGLPLKSAYIRTGGKTPQNFCCHNVDHNTAKGYTYECKKWLHDNVWNTLVDKRKKHEVNAENILAALKRCSSTFKGVLTKRGKRNDGTQSSYENRFDEDEWYHPFSMAQEPTPRSPGGRNMPPILKMIG